MTVSKDRPYPPFALANRVLRLPSDDLAGFIQYEMMGRSTHEEIIGLLPEGYSFEGRRVLDFGCGAGRTLRHFLTEAETAELRGVDIDGRSIDWMRENLCPPLHADRSDVDPPLPFEADSFDLVWAISVFTHLTGNSLPWLHELHRILKPGGLLMASYMGEINLELIAGEEWDEDRIGMNVLRHNQPWDDGGPMTFMSDWWVDEHWGRAFEIRERGMVHGQTWAMMEKKDITLTVDNLIEPGDDPREWKALRHNIAQLQREIELTAEAVTPRGLAQRALAKAQVATTRARQRLKRA